MCCGIVGRGCGEALSNVSDPSVLPKRDVRDKGARLKEIPALASARHRAVAARGIFLSLFAFSYIVLIFHRHMSTCGEHDTHDTRGSFRPVHGRQDPG